MTIPNPVITPEIRLKHFLYMSEENNTFITGDPESHKHFAIKNVPSLTELVKADPLKVCRIIANVNDANALPHRKTLFYILACTLKSTNVNRNHIYTTALNAIKTHKDLFDFIKYLTKIKGKFASGLNNIIKRYYLGIEPMILIKDVCQRKGYHSWTHKDLIKLSHVKTDDPLMNVVITYILKGLSVAEEAAGDNQDALPIIEYIKASEEFKRSMNEENALKFINEHEISYENCPERLRKSPKILEVVLKNTDLQIILELLVKLWKIGVMKLESDIVTRTVVEILSDPDKVKSSQVQPLEVFLATKSFEKGGKAKDPRLIKYLEDLEKQKQASKPVEEQKKTNFAQRDPIKYPAITSALNKCLTLSYQNVKPTSRRFLITVEVSENMDKPCLNSKNLTGNEAAAIQVLTYLKSEKNVIVAVFNAAKITEVVIDKGASVGNVIKKFKQAKSGLVQMGAPMEWARQKKKSIDVFINIAHNMDVRAIITKDQPLVNPWEAFVKYKSAMNMSTPKLVLNNLDGAMVFSNIPNNAIDIRGFDKNVPKIIDSFLKNHI